MILLKLINLAKYFGGVKAVDGVSLEIAEGEQVTIIGPNGSGKTTLINLISGLHRPDRGQVLFLGREVTGLQPVERIRMGIVRSFQLVNIFNQMTVLENVLVSVLARKGMMWNFTKLVAKDRDSLEEAEGVLRNFGLDNHMDKYPGELSGGDRKILDVAIAYALRPRFLMLDEPTSGVSTKEKMDIMQRIYDALAESKVASLVVEHDMDLVFRFSKRILVMHQGRVIADGPPDAIKGRDDVRSVLLGEIYA